MKNRIWFCFGFLFLVAVSLSFCTLATGPVWVSWPDFFSALFAGPSAEVGADSITSQIIWRLRVPRMCAAVLAGSSLSVAGLALQTVFCNPLAGPFVLGISSGASLGVALSLLAGFSFGNFGVLGAAAVGASAVTIIVMWVSGRFRNVGVLLIVGLLLGYLIDAIVSVLIAGSEAEALRVYVTWSMGSFGRMLLDGVWVFALAVAAGLGLVVVSMRYLNAARLGDDFARGLGVRVEVSKKCVLLGASILAAACTAFCGPVAFVGIAVPHLAFMLFKTTDHRVLVPGAALCGTVLCLLAGLFPVSIPLNAVLSIVGVPVVFYVLVRGSRTGWW